MRLGQWWSGTSRKAHEYGLELKYLDPLIEYARSHKDENIDMFIFGHMHIPHTVSNPCITFLGNWADGCSWAQLDDNGNITLKINEL